MYTMFLGFLDAPDDGEAYAIISDKLLMTIYRFLFSAIADVFQIYSFKFVQPCVSNAWAYAISGKLALVFFEIIIFL